jgi:hypothetical protein
LRGGFGHGLAVDLVSVNGESESLWRWIDDHGKKFGIGRPYLDKDPPHVAPIDGKEYADHHREAHGPHVGSEKKKHNRLVARDNGETSKPRQTLTPSAVDTHSTKISGRRVARRLYFYY